MTKGQVLADLAPHRMVAAANLLSLVQELKGLGLAHADAERIVVEAFTIGVTECDRVWQRCTDATD